MTRFDTCLTRVLKHEGGFVDHPRDPGGATNQGITQGTYDAWLRGHGQEPRSVADITAGEVAAIYREQYWREGLPVGVDYAVFDYAVNSGPAQAARDLQRVVGSTVDGVIGVNTIAAARDAADQLAVVQQLCDRRLVMLKGLRHWSTFGRGWARRVAEVREAAGADMRGADAPAVTRSTGKADPDQRKATTDIAAAAKDWKAWAGALGPVGGFLVAAADFPEPVLWGLTFAICALSTAGAVLLVKGAIR